MCRLLAFHVKGKLDNNLIQALKKVSEYDELSMYKGHPDGWGIVALIREGKEWNMIYHRSSKPAYQDSHFDEIEISGDEIIGIAHVRKAGKIFLLGVNHSHPYHLRSSGYDLFFAHNGSVNRTAFSSPQMPYTDSYLILHDISSLIDEGYSPPEAYRKEFERIMSVSSSLNSALLYMRGKEVGLIILHYFNKELMHEKNEEYYKIYCDSNYCVSSSLLKYLPKNYSMERIPIGFKQL